MDLFVKICGLTSSEQARHVSELAPDAVGFVFWPASRRAVTAEQVGSWRTSDGVRRVGVFVDAPPEQVARTVQRARLDVVQLHGGEDAQAYRGLAPMLWQVVHLDRPGLGVSGRDVDALLLDSYSAVAPGGTGCRVDWTRAARFVDTCGTPVLLAGGLDAACVVEAVERVRPWGVDVSSGVEGTDGLKNLDSVKEFIERCRNV